MVHQCRLEVMKKNKLSSPSKEAAKAFTSSIAGVVPVIGPIISSSMTAAIQADNTKKLNGIIMSLEKEIQELKRGIASLQLTVAVNPSKDTNEVHKKRKELAVMLTILNEKKINS